MHNLGLRTFPIHKALDTVLNVQLFLFKVQIKTTKCRSPCNLYISKKVSMHYEREKYEHINNKSTTQN